MFEPLAAPTTDGTLTCRALARWPSWLAPLVCAAALVGCSDSGPSRDAYQGAAYFAPPQSFQPMTGAYSIEQAGQPYDPLCRTEAPRWSPFEPSPTPTRVRMSPLAAAHDATADDEPTDERADESRETDDSSFAAEPRSTPAKYAHSRRVARQDQFSDERASATDPATERWIVPAHGEPFAATNVLRGSATLAAVNQAGVHYRRAFELANRGAAFAARAELLAGLRALAEGFDADSGRSTHSDLLAVGLRALEEADDFSPRSGPWPTEADVARAMRSHRTPIVPSDDREPNASTMQQAYLAFAAQRLSAAVERETVGAQLLHGLGKTYGLLAAQPSRINRGATGKAIAFHHATLLAAPRHHLAANDLAVLLAQEGRWSDAAGWLTYSLSLQPSAAAWHNLAVAQANLGQQRAAEHAERSALVAAGGSRAVNDPALAPWLNVRWMQPGDFAGTSAPATDPRTVTTPAVSNAAALSVENGRNARPELREARRSTWNN
ncbi:MAG: hypothetical protein JSS27_09925 [Planctomycetes bacterium]|nr:hypothetical protein [Planctomycetota bacterium]